MVWKKHIPSLVGPDSFSICASVDIYGGPVIHRLASAAPICLVSFFFFLLPCPLSAVHNSRPCHATDCSAPFVLGRIRFHFDTVLDFRDERLISPFHSGIVHARL